MTWEQTKDIAELIIERFEQGHYRWAERLWEKALQDGADFDKLERAICEARYGAMIPG